MERQNEWNRIQKKSVSLVNMIVIVALQYVLSVSAVVAIVQKNLNAQIGVNMWFFLISSIASSIIGSAADSWFADTKLGRWFYKKVDDVASWASKKLGLKVLQNEDNWRKKYPNVAKKIDNLEARILELEKEK